MRDERRNYVIVGAFVLVVLAGLLAWLALLSGRTGATDPYFVVYDSVMGLAPGTQVLYEGFGVGIIDGIDPIESDGTLRFKVNVSIRRGWPIPEDARAVVTAPGFLSAVVIDIRDGTSSTALAPGSEIRAAEAANLVATVSAVADEITSMKEKVDPILDSLAREAPEIVGNLRTFSADLNQTGERLTTVLGPANVDRIGTILANVESASADLAQVVGELDTTRAQMDRLLERSNALLEEDTGKLDHAITDLHQSLEALARHSDAVALDLEVTSRNLSEFTRQLRENPSVLLRGRSGDEAGEPN